TIFMEWLDGVTLGEPARAGRDEETTIAFAAVVAGLHRPRSEPLDGLQPLRDRFQLLFDTDVRAWPHPARALCRRSAGIALCLFGKPCAIVALHGGLQHRTVFSAERGWLAIAPKGLLGDPS